MLLTSNVTVVAVLDKTLNGVSEKAIHCSSPPDTATELSERSSQVVGEALGEAVGGVVVFANVFVGEKNPFLIGALVGASVGASVGADVGDRVGGSVVRAKFVSKNDGGLVGATTGSLSHAQATSIEYLQV